MSENAIEFGKQAEKTAAEFLKANGYKILQCNYRNKFGEIDIIAQDKATICFVEVKARHSVNLGIPEEAVFTRKQIRICKVAISYLKTNNLLERLSRFDVLTLLYTDNLPKISLIKDAFELSASFTL
ncbi:MAG: YraN family protein [Candidatus Omnitrophota bacterium]|nr:YraN family protein [Candidatus Omnitrophota bacterium]